MPSVSARPNLMVRDLSCVLCLLQRLMLMVQETRLALSLRQ